MIFLRNLLRHKVRSLMTLLGAAVGIAIYVSTTAITDNMAKETRLAIEEYNTDLTIQSRGAATPFQSHLKADDMAGLRTIPGMIVDPLVIGAFREEWNPYTILLGAPADVLKRFGLVEGSYPAPGTNELIIGSILAQRLRLKAGDRLSLAEEPARIAGIYCSGNRLFDGALAAEISEAQRRIGRKDQINLALARVTDKAALKQRIEEINSRFPRLQALSSGDFVGNIRFVRTISTFARAVAFISFFGSCLVVTNTLLMAVAERTREVGILMAVGWRPGLILGMLAAESLTICLCGAVAGNGLALLILRLLNNSRAIGLGWIPVTISAEIFITSIGAAIILGAISMVWPAVLLARISPVDAIRYE